ncbi:MAG TPA: ATP-grasp domain-containing protein [Clostridia bacterium]|nr:ATP-grasp domain-containing protein [Clostridia bacterium]
MKERTVYDRPTNSPASSVFVTDGDNRSTLAVVRSLGQAGITVTVGSPGARSLAGSSRWASAEVSYPSPLTHPSEFRSFMREHIGRHPYSILLPMTDVTVQLLSTDADFLSQRVLLPLPGTDQVRRVQDKAFVLSEARQLGIGIPQTYWVSGAAELEALSGRVQYPVVVKPRLSWLLRDGEWGRGGVEYAHNAEELFATYSRCHAQIPLPLIQEHLEGEGRGVFVLLWRGELKAAFCHRRIREKPPSGGVSVYSESVPPNDELIEKSVSLLRRLGWEGPAMVEFKIDAKTGEPKLMEINGRFWGSLQLAIEAGVNFPVLLYRLAAGEEVQPQMEYSVGTKNRWLLGDLQRLIMAMKEDGSHTLAAKLRMCLEFFPVYERHGHLEDVQMADMGPFFFECRSAVRSMFSRLHLENNKDGGSTSGLASMDDSAASLISLNPKR